jgi:serine/threonine-protein kinase
MNDDDRWLEIAGQILDGKPVAWDTIPDDRPPDDASADALRLIAEVADLHRAPEGKPGRRWGTLAIQERIGHGTFGDVYRARDGALDRDVALKLVDHTPSATAPDEGRLLARVRHSNVVTVYGAAIHDGRYGIWMEFIRGRTLAAVVREHGPLDPEDVTAIGIDVCRALTAVHESGLLHGDIKPQNVMREEGGRIVVMDFGTGRVAKGGGHGDRLAGTPLYLAPEVLTGAAPDVRADVYSAGVLLYYLLTGAHPVEGSTLEKVRAAHASGARTPVRSRRPEMPLALAAIIERATAVEPSARFESATAFESALRESSAKHSRPLSKRFVALMGVSVLIAALVGGRRLISMTAEATAKADARNIASSLYNESYDLGFKDDWKSALTLVNRAIAEDDALAVAHTWKAWCLANTHARLSTVIGEAKRAVELSVPPGGLRVSAWERLWIEASYDRFTGDTTKEVAALTELVKLRPDHFWAVSNLADMLHARGRTQEALPYYIQASELRPLDALNEPAFFDTPFIIRAATALLRAGEADRAVRYAYRARQNIRMRMESGRGGWFTGASSAWTLPIEALWRSGDLRDAAAKLGRECADCSQLAESARTDLAGSLVTANLSLGRLRAAAAVAGQRFIAPGSYLIGPENDRHFKYADIAFHGGRSQSLRNEMSLASGAWGAESLPFYLIAAGRFHEAQEYLDALPTLPQPDRGAIQVDRGVLALARGDRVQALASLRDARPLEIHPQSIYRFEYLADVYVQQRDWMRAIATLEDSLHFRSVPFQALWWMRNELRLAELYHATGRDVDALPLEAHLDQLLVAADSDFPLLMRLRALERKTRPH